MNKLDYIGKKYSELTDEKNSEIQEDGFLCNQFDDGVYILFPSGIKLKSAYERLETIPCDAFDGEGIVQDVDVAKNAVYEECTEDDIKWFEEIWTQI